MQSFKIICTLNLHEVIAVIGEIVMLSCKNFTTWKWLHWLKLILRSLLKWWQFTFLYSNIRIYFLDTVLSTSPNMLTWKICLAIKSFFSWWSFALFSWPYVWSGLILWGEIRHLSLLGVKTWTLCAVDLCFAVVRGYHLALVSILFLFIFHFICLLHVHVVPFIFIFI